MPSSLSPLLPRAGCQRQVAAIDALIALSATRRQKLLSAKPGIRYQARGREHANVDAKVIIIFGASLVART